jgi:Ca2+-binding RTX toxin-like protein
VFLGGTGDDSLSWDASSSPLFSTVEIDGGDATGDAFTFTGKAVAETVNWSQSGDYVQFSPSVGGVSIATGKMKNTEKATYYAGDGDDVGNASAVASSVAIDFYFYGQGGNDALTGNGRKNWLYGGSGDDNLYGEAGDDNLYGEDGIDRLDGGAGTDTFTGGGGSDRYFFASLADLNDDIVMDFSDNVSGNEDVIDWSFVSSWYYTGNANGDLWVYDHGGKRILLKSTIELFFGGEDIELS